MATSVVKPVVFRIGETATFGVKTDVIAPWKYQWMRNGVNIGGSHWASMTTPPLVGDDLKAKYSVTVHGQNGTETSVELLLGEPLGIKPTPAEIAAAANVAKTGVPAILQALPGNGLVAINWTPVPGAGSYRVKRGIQKGGPYSHVDSLITAPSHNDTGLVNGTTYFYVVSALVGAVESANSAELSAIPGSAGPIVQHPVKNYPGPERRVASSSHVPPAGIIERRHPQIGIGQTGHVVAPPPPPPPPSIHGRKL